ncbi:putative TIR domain-containing protein [Helianthus annuus]|uniref:TIR domain-containing protein n=1 Tax=Helianthus annuus TaxID=4232 RepID=A0A9K3I2D5_HELAN|nr:putative TIR domain-containing protein [Helianthus annuus]
MASTSSASSSVQKIFKYDVFLSFRGEDTRKTFVDHLYLALVNKGIITYKDDETIKKGERINEQLIKSIEESRYYIIVFSKNYASSSWCLDELVKIMECQKMTEHTAYPIFYDVEPTEVRNQSGSVGQAFERFTRKSKRTLEDEDLEKELVVGKWRNALKEAASLAGMELKNTFNGTSRPRPLSWDAIARVIFILSPHLFRVFPHHLPHLLPSPRNVGINDLGTLDKIYCIH